MFRARSVHVSTTRFTLRMKPVMQIHVSCWMYIVLYVVCSEFSHFPMVGLGVAPHQLLLLALIDCCVVPEMCVGVCKTWGDGG